jgi:hypothetical protein
MEFNLWFPYFCQQAFLYCGLAFAALAALFAVTRRDELRY